MWSSDTKAFCSRMLALATRGGNVSMRGATPGTLTRSTTDWRLLHSPMTHSNVESVRTDQSGVSRARRPRPCRQRSARASAFSAWSPRLCRTSPRCRCGRCRCAGTQRATRPCWLGWGRGEQACSAKGTKSAASCGASTRSWWTLSSHTRSRRCATLPQTRRSAPHSPARCSTHPPPGRMKWRARSSLRARWRARRSCRLRRTGVRCCACCPPPRRSRSCAAVRGRQRAGRCSCRRASCAPWRRPASPSPPGASSRTSSTWRAGAGTSRAAASSTWPTSRAAATASRQSRI
mmetsp:Transcript_25323/g.59533  ORF Transcript_25323/g.59533 Transcript_25323/m.59533 type:complete len:291 (+) Transcript_25323:1192-2064(+)